MMARAAHRSKPLAQQRLQLVAIEMAEPETLSACGRLRRNPRRRSRRRSTGTRAPAASRRPPVRRRRPETTGRAAGPPACSDARVSTMCSRQSPESVSRSCEPRPYIHSLAFAGVVMRQRKMRRAVAERLAHRDALGVERVGDAADRGLRAFLVDVPALEMLERAGIHHDQRRMDDRPGIHQRARQRVAAGLDHAGKGAADHVERMSRQSRAETRRSAAAWRGW